MALNKAPIGMSIVISIKPRCEIVFKQRLYFPRFHFLSNPERPDEIPSEQIIFTDLGTGWYHFTIDISLLTRSEACADFHPDKKTFS
jgi:hypothetical protein